MSIPPAKKGEATGEPEGLSPVAQEEIRHRLAAQRAEFQKIVDEANETLDALRGALAEEARRREVAEAELENLKKGSITMMKYATNLQRKKHDEEVAHLEGRVRAFEERARQFEKLNRELEARKKETHDLETYLAEQYEKLERERSKASPSLAPAGEPPRRSPSSFLKGKRRK